MFGIGIPELIIILVIILLLFGASRLPEIGRGLGKGIKNFKESTKDEDRRDDRIAQVNQSPIPSSLFPFPFTCAS